MENRAIEPDSARSHTFAILSPAIEELERMLRYYSTVLKDFLAEANSNLQKEKKMWFWKHLVVIVFVAVGTLAVASPGTADHHAKNGTFEFILAADHDYTVVEQAGQTITAGSLKGSITLITSSGGPFKEGSSQTVLGVILGLGVTLSTQCFKSTLWRNTASVSYKHLTLTTSDLV